MAPRPGSQRRTCVFVPVASDHPGSLSAQITSVAGREVVLVEVSGEHRRGALSEADGHTFAAAAEHALAAGLPLLATIASSGADVNDGVAALHGWGTAARVLARCSGRVPVLHRRHRTRRVRARRCSWAWPTRS